MKRHLTTHEKNYEFTETIRHNTLKSLRKRFDSLVSTDIILVSTFLDPRFGLAAFEDHEKDKVLSRIKALVKKLIDKNSFIENPINSFIVEPETKKDKIISDMEKNFFFSEEVSDIPVKKIDFIDNMLNDFTRLTTSCRKETKCPLEFWSKYEMVYPELSKIAKKYLSVQASSAACERIFSIAGHIFSLKRRRLCHGLFSDLVFLKLNEDLL